MLLSTLFVLASAWLAGAKVIVITVGGNTTDDGTTTFVPQRVDAVAGDTVVFNFTNGNHTATESTFSGPCTPAHDTDVTINGFNSGFRNTQPNTTGTILSVPINRENENHTFWFFDYNTCGQGGVGAINNNESSSETVAGFARNAIRLNGTNSSDSTSTSTGFRTSSTARPSPSASARRSGADRAFTVGTLGAIPLLIASLFL
ncbi:hypothetical protein BC826DRAFT_342621 [Russula brevipes]|nr:hypothetical protein BC826DRAFT_342621 [Russula brevipes]